MVAGYSPSPLLAATREYELVLMLDAGQDAPARNALAQQARTQIEGGGTLKHENNWGLRKLAYEIAQRNEADYRWFRFEAAPDLLQELDHNLKITDGVLRFRIFKVDPDAPVLVPPATAAPGPESSRERPPAPPRAAPQPPAEAAPEAAAPAEPTPEAAPAEPAPEAEPAEPAPEAEPAAAEPDAVEPAEPAAETAPAEPAADPSE
jgi:ribosomal protein S6